MASTLSKTRVSVAAVAGCAALAIGTAAPAVADTGDDTRTEVSRQTLNMGVVGFDVERAEAAGNSVTEEGSWQVLRDSDGVEISRVPTDGAKTDGIVYGDCGSSYIYIYDEPGALTFSFETGFDVEAPAFDFAWSIFISSSGDSGGFGYEWEDYGPMFADPSWTSGLQQETTSESTSGYDHFAEVTSGIAFLTDGQICMSGLPSAVATVY